MASKRPKDLRKPWVPMIIANHLECLQFAPLLLDGVNHFPERNAYAHGFHHQFFHIFAEQALAVAGAWPGRLCHQRADTGLDHQPAFLHQILHHLVCGIGMDLEVDCESPHRGEGFTRLQFAREDGAGGGVAHLLENGLAGIELDLELDHGGASAGVGFVSHVYCDS